MKANPYEFSADTTNEPQPKHSGMVLGMLGLLFGFGLGSLAGLVSGCFTGLTYRAIHDVSYSNSGPLSFLGTTSSPSDFALRHALIALIPFAVWGGLVGWFQLRSAGQSCIGAGSLIIYCSGGLILGAINGASVTPGQNYYPTFC